MKKIITSAFLLILIILGGCSIDFNDEKDKKISSLEKQVLEIKEKQKNDLFQKRQECIKYKDEMLNFAINYKTPTGDYIPNITKIEEVFYSPTADSCYFVGIGNNSGGKIIFNYLTLKVIARKGFGPICSNIVKEKNKQNCYLWKAEREDEFNIKLKKLKGE